jgi:tetratricopeptide (TPR) repeat protein
MLRAVGRAVLGALEACHDAGIIHRDIKPENLVLCADGSVKVLDFGLSHTASVDVRLTQSGAVMGTPLYMSPEQARGDDVDVRTDLYALGAVLYECASGRPPFVAPVYSVLVAMILEVKPNPERVAHLSAPVREIILASLAKQPAQRPPTASLMLAALGEGPDDADWDIPRPLTNPALADAATLMPKDTRPESAAPTMAAPVAKAEAVTRPNTPDTPDTPEPPVPRTRYHVPEPPVPRTRYVVPVVLVAALTLIGVAVMAWPRGGGSKATRGAGAGTGWQSALSAGDVERAMEEARREVAKRPDDLELAGRDLLLALCEDRTRAYERLAELEGRTLPVFAAAAAAATRAVASGQPEIGVDALGAASATVAAGSSDELLVRFAKGYLLLLADRFDRARVEYTAILDRWPGFLPAIDALLEPLLVRDELDEAHRRVEAFVTAAPPGPAVDKLEIELAIGERRYRDALDRVERMIAADPGRVDEVYQFRGDLRVLLGDPAGAIAAYDPIDDRWKHDGYIAGALAGEGHVGEARALLVAAMRDYPPDIKQSRLGKLMVDACLLALETDDVELARLALAALTGRDVRKLEAPVQSAHAFARGTVAALEGTPIDAGSFPLGADSPLHVLLAVRGRTDAASIALAREATALEHMHQGVVTTHIYPALWLERARIESVAGDGEAALEWIDRVLRPRHYDAARGIVVLRALDLQATVLASLGRAGEADAVRREILQLRGSQR